MDGPLLSNVPIGMRVSLMVDALYLNEAERALELAAKRGRAAKRVMQQVDRLNRRRERILEEHHGNTLAAYDALEPISVQLEGAEYDLGVTYAPFLQAIAVIHILTGASLEAHINARGRQLLSGKPFKLFERFSLEAKWLTLPQLLGVAGFDAGAEPFQSFSRLVKLRNALVHYKPKKEDWIPPGVPRFLCELGLTQEDGERSLRAAKRMISRLSSQLGEPEPLWLHPKSRANYFDVEFV